MNNADEDADEVVPCPSILIIYPNIMNNADEDVDEVVPCPSILIIYPNIAEDAALRLLHN